MIETSTFTVSIVALQEQLRSKFCSLSGVHRLVCVHPDQIQEFLACIFTLLHWENFVDNFRMYPCTLFTCGRQHEIFWQLSSTDIVKESSSIFQDSTILNKDFWNWACNLLSCIHLIILFELLTKSIQNRCTHLGGYVFNNVICTSRFIQLLTRTSFP